MWSRVSHILHTSFLPILVRVFDVLAGTVPTDSTDFSLESSPYIRHPLPILIFDLRANLSKDHPTKSPRIPLSGTGQPSPWYVNQLPPDLKTGFKLVIDQDPQKHRSADSPTPGGSGVDGLQLL